MTWRGLTALLLLGSLLAAGGCKPPVNADLILVKGRIVTLDDRFGTVEALAAGDGVILAVGTNEEVQRYVGPETRTIDLHGRLAVPGLIDSHAHFTGIGRALMNIDLRGAASWEDLVQIIAAAAEETRPGEWILGWGWHQDKWERVPQPAVEGYPTHVALSRAVPDHPVLLKHAAGSHAGLVNARAMELAGIDRDTPDPEGGRILRDRRGEPTGVLRETAYRLALDAYTQEVERMDEEQRERLARREIDLANRACLSRGITSLHDAGSSFETVDRMREMARSGRLGVRLYVMLSEENDRLRERIAEYRIEDDAGGRVTVRAVKRWIDGALGSHGAWLLQPYNDLPHSSGLNTMPLDELRETARIAAENDFQLCVHAIGDRGNRESLDIFEETFAAYPGNADRRWRVEHAQHLSPEDVPRFAELGVIASMQGIHCTSDGPWVPERLGAKRCEEGAYVWRKLIDSGAVVVNGTDAPIENVDPIANFFASVTRQTASGEAFYPEQRMTRMEALRSYTIDAAYAAFQEDRKGTLTPGKLADVTVLSRDILKVREDAIPGTEVLYTIVGGEVLYEK
jgi:predicted amidohydrolase YtcJ